MTDGPIVSWAGPVQRAARRIDLGTEAMEAKRFQEGVEHFQRARLYLDQAIEFIRSTEKRKST